MRGAGIHPLALALSPEGRGEQLRRSLTLCILCILARRQRPLRELFADFPGFRDFPFAFPFRLATARFTAWR